MVLNQGKMEKTKSLTCGPLLSALSLSSLKWPSWPWSWRHAAAVPPMPPGPHSTSFLEDKRTPCPCRPLTQPPALPAPLPLCPFPPKRKRRRCSSPIRRRYGHPEAYRRPPTGAPRSTHRHGPSNRREASGINVTAVLLRQPLLQVEPMLDAARPSPASPSPREVSRSSAAPSPTASSSESSRDALTWAC